MNGVLLDAGMILRFVSHRYRVPVEAVRGRRRSADLVRPRWVAMWLARRLLPSRSLAELGLVFNRLNVATVVREAFEEHKARIPAGNDNLRTDLHQVERIAGATGAPRLAAEDDPTAESHADRFWAAALGLAGGSPEPGLIGFYRQQAEAAKARAEKGAA